MASDLRALPRRRAAAARRTRAEGGLGLPIFAGGRAGRPGGPTAGYLLGFVDGAYVVGWLAERGRDHHFGRAATAMAAGQAAVYLCGLPWLALHAGAVQAVPLGLLPILPGDAAKLLLAAASLPAAWVLGTAPRTPAAPLSSAVGGADDVRERGRPDPV